MLQRAPSKDSEPSEAREGSIQIQWCLNEPSDTLRVWSSSAKLSESFEGWGKGGGS